MATENAFTWTSVHIPKIVHEHYITACRICTLRLGRESGHVGDLIARRTMLAIIGFDQTIAARLREEI